VAEGRNLRYGAKAGGFLIIPMKNMPKSRTTFSLDDSDSLKRAGKWQYIWRKYLNNWGAFSTKRIERQSKQIYVASRRASC
jgi:hypothetical protein